jgi:hypothetical protein
MAVESFTPYTANDGRIMTFPEKTSASAFAKGDLVQLVAGYVDLAAAGTSTNILGIALRAYGNHVDTEIPVLVLRPGDMFVARYSTTTTAALPGTSLDITFTTAAGYISTGTTYKQANVVMLDPRDATGATYGRLICAIVPHYLVAGSNLVDDMAD